MTNNAFRTMNDSGMLSCIFHTNHVHFGKTVTTEWRPIQCIGWLAEGGRIYFQKQLCIFRLSYIFWNLYCLPHCAPVK